MPVTPFHFGPALVMKALLRGRFSLGVFTLSQAIIDTESHVALDGIMHADMAPFAPLTDINPLLWPDGLAALHLGCVVLGMVGVLIWGYRSATPSAP